MIQEVRFQAMSRQVSYGKLLRLAHQRAIDGKGGLAASIAKMCLDQQAELTESELDLTYQILRQLIDKVEVQIRRNIADILAERVDVPQDLLGFLLNDAVHVAYPIIVRSRQVTEADLLGVVTRGSPGHAVAVASRPELSEAVAARLVDVGEAEVDRTLLRNETARIGRASLETLVERSIEAEDYRDLIVKRRDLPDDLARRMYIWVGDALRQHIAQHFDIDGAVLDESVDEAVWRALDDADATQDRPASAASGGWSAEEALASARRDLQRMGRLLRTLERDGRGVFIAGIAVEAGLPEETTERLFAPANPQTTAIACKALGMTANQFIAVLEAFREPDDWSDFVAGGGLDRVCAYFERIDRVGAASVLRRWRRSPPDGGARPH
ncbi:MAG: DUF2336 domain-containing protein [Alphaproteobacteria bacterium]|nr:DUF2336 domain-containing protein [Alphaproteobacteria bacterium]